MAFRVAVFSLLSVFLSSCVPGFLSKYRNGRENSEVQSGAAISARADTKKAGPGATPMSPMTARPKHPVIFALDQGTFRFQLGFDRV
ncbi:MAG: hypothetical protein NTX25_21845, partial [Proteobacteria bacterium]|nr:hypothetical protein [Pseudomonadota bacterium]